MVHYIKEATRRNGIWKVTGKEDNILLTYAEPTLLLIYKHMIERGVTHIAGNDKLDKILPRNLYAEWFNEIKTNNLMKKSQKGI